MTFFCLTWPEESQRGSMSCPLPISNKAPAVHPWWRFGAAQTIKPVVWPSSERLFSLNSLRNMRGYVCVCLLDAFCQRAEFLKRNWSPSVNYRLLRQTPQLCWKWLFLEDGVHTFLRAGNNNKVAEPEKKPECLAGNQFASCLCGCLGQLCPPPTPPL